MADRTNISGTTYDFGGQRYEQQTRTDSQGNKYTVDIPTANIPVSSTAPTTPIPITAPQYKDYTPNISSNLAYTQNAFNTAQTNADNLRSQAQSQSSDIAQLLQQQGGKTADLNAQMKLSGATDLANEIRKLNAQSNALALDTQAKTLAEQNKATGQNITSTAVQRNTADATRENFINQANIAMQVAIKTADYQAAKDIATQIVDAKYNQIETDIKAKQYNLEALQQFSLTPAEKKLADAQTAKLKKEEEVLVNKKEQDKAIQNLIIEATPFAPQDIIAKANDIYTKGGTPTQVAQALGVYGKDFLANQKLKVELQKAKVDLAKASQDLSTVQTPEVSAWVSNIRNGKAKLSDVPQKLKSAVSIGLSQATTEGADSPKIQALQETTKNIDSLLSSNGLSLSVGTAPLGRMDVLSPFRSDRQDFIAGVQQIISQKTLDTLINLKSQGGTLGALSDQERLMLQGAASKIGSWAEYDPNNPGKVIGYNTSEASFKKELETLKSLTQKAIKNAGGSTGNPVAEAYFQTSSKALQSANTSSPAVSAGYVDNQK